MQSAGRGGTRIDTDQTLLGSCFLEVNFGERQWHASVLQRGVSSGVAHFSVGRRWIASNTPLVRLF